jgi:TetR/AcrR family transcriptional regulator, cholesterol catabolism regulator
MYQPEISDRFSDILDAAIQLFATRGYNGTSIRDVAESVGLLSGSLYHHIKSKESLFLQVHERVLSRASERLNRAIHRHNDPWKKLEVACTTLCAIIQEPNSPIVAFADEPRRLPASIRSELEAQRTRFEAIFLGIIQELPLDHKIDQTVYVSSLLYSLISTSRLSPSMESTPGAAGKQIFEIFRRCGV